MMQQHLHGLYNDEKNTVVKHFHNLMKDNYFDKKIDMISQDEFINQCDNWCSHGKHPVIYRDVLYFLLGYMVAIDPSDVKTTLDFYEFIIKDNENYAKYLAKNEMWRKRGCDPDLMDIADIIYSTPSP